MGRLRATGTLDDHTHRASGCNPDEYITGEPRKQHTHLKFSGEGEGDGMRRGEGGGGGVKIRWSGERQGWSVSDG